MIAIDIIGTERVNTKVFVLHNQITSPLEVYQRKSKFGIIK